MNVRGTPRERMVQPRIGPGLHGDEAIPAVVVGERAAHAVKIGIERRIVHVDGMVIAPRSVRLPDLDERSAHGLAVLVEDAAGDDHALAERGALAVHREVAVLVADESLRHERSGNIEGARGDLEELLLRRAQVRAAIVLVEIGRIDGGGARQVVHGASS